MKRSTLAIPTVLGLLMSVTAAQANPLQERMYDGRSVYGAPAAAQQASKVIDVAKVSTLNVECGETVVFRNGEQSFAWKFDTVGHRSVKLASIAPKEFGSKPFTVYVSRNEAERT
jgi:hypothetical protein